nr:serine/threonine protein kinase [Myxococcota bacterium]
MPCPDDTKIIEFVARGLPATAAAGIEAHLADCDECRNLVFALASSGDAGPDGDAKAAERIGRFEVIDVIGRGAMGVVYRARDPELDRIVAIKVRRTQTKLDVEGEDRLRREAQALARLAHPNVVAVHEIGRHEGTVYVAMEHVDGLTLDAWLAPGRPIPEVLSIMLGAGRGLAAAHAAGLVHRDFKPRNVFISTGEHVAKVGDFGLVRVEREGTTEVAATDLSMTLSVMGSIVGTPAYMAPEQLRGEAATEASDQFSYCVTLFEALHGKRPFVGSTLDELRTAMTRGLELPALPRLPGTVRQALRRGLELEPQRRFSSMAALL